MSKELIISKLVIDKSEIDDGQEAARIASDDEYKKCHWKPTLQTIQEATSPPLNAADR